MSQARFLAMPCPVAHASAVLGERWVILILREAYYGSTRFEEFQRRLGIASNILSARLQAMTDHGLLERRRLEGSTRCAYFLTDSARDFLPTYLSLKAWAERWVAEPKRRAKRFVDKQTGSEIVAPPLSRADGSPIVFDDIQVIDAQVR
ncbi:MULTISPECIES: winged helix-turn-helix transcriptional regulator [Cupriavidus]|uniref:Transcriptional regulator n=1 Tax=Cupriavidus oxalaticus TaxID=96344 RepID=A0A4P7LG00_9BURK|nr:MULTISPECIES: helix-turn-helix domain-containing protein [Cupriavidus]MBF6987564.1 helix-turn-helix transcriptional regulator [Cupriavidus sp. IK-TO18]QBY53269.1 transcriptional regulator [Cupriavidus oxalaticus]TDF63442.1 transcriptional regulator [Cupriavidus sp. L7L]